MQEKVNSFYILHFEVFIFTVPPRLEGLANFKADVFYFPQYSASVFTAQRASFRERRLTVLSTAAMAVSME